MLVRSARLRKRSLIAATYKYGKSFNSPILYIKAKKSAVTTSQCMIVVPKKVSKKAVVRNKLRRQISEILRTHWASLPTGYTIILTAKAGSLTQSYGQLESTILQLLKGLK